MIKHFKLTLALALSLAFLCGGNLYADPSEWAKDALFNLHTMDLIPQKIDRIESMKKKITREEFAEFLFNYYAYVSGDNESDYGDQSPFKDSDNQKVIALHQMKILKGNDRALFAPNDFLTREQAASMIMNLFLKLGVEGNSDFAAVLFSDDAEISPWARKAVYFCYREGVINGRQDHCFAPKDLISVEEVAGILERIGSGRTTELGTFESKDFHGYKIPVRNRSGILISSLPQEGVEIRFLLGSFEGSLNEKKEIRAQIFDLYSILKDKIGFQDLILLTDIAREEWSMTDLSYPYGVKYIIKEGKSFRLETEAFASNQFEKPYIRVSLDARMSVEIVR